MAISAGSALGKDDIRVILKLMQKIIKFKNIIDRVKILQVNFSKIFCSIKLATKTNFHLNMWIRSPQGVKDDSEKMAKL